MTVFTKKQYICYIIRSFNDFIFFMKIFLFLSVLYFISSIPLFSQQYRSEFIENIMHIKLDPRSISYQDTIKLMINERMGDHDAKGTLQFQKQEKASFGDVWIKGITNQNIRKLSKKEIKQQHYTGAESLYEDRMVTYFTAKHDQYPYIIDYTQKYERKKYTHIISLDYSKYEIPIKKGILTLEHPIDINIKQHVKNVDIHYTDTIDQTIYHRYHFTHKPNFRQEKYASVNTSKSPQIIISPINFKYGIEGRNDNWITFGNWIFELNKGRDILPQSEKDIIQKLIEQEKDKREQIKILYRYLQEKHRYINVSTKIGGLQTHPAEYVVNNRYGDCKALTNYMQSILKFIDIDSYYTLIYNDNQVYDLDEKFSYNAFNHAILTIPLEGDTIHLECTSKNNPFGYLGTTNQGRKALLIKENESKLIQIPKLSAADVLCTRDFTINISKDESAIVNLESRLKGYTYERVSAYEAYTNSNTMNQFIRDNIFEGTFDIIDYQIQRNNESEEVYIDLSVNCKMNYICKTYGKNTVLNSFSLGIPVFETPETRTQDLQIDIPIYKKDKQVIKFENETISKIPSDIILVSPYDDYYKISFKLEKGDTVIVEKEFLISAKRLNLAEYKDFYLFVNKVKEKENSKIYFEIL